MNRIKPCGWLNGTTQRRPTSQNWRPAEVTVRCAHRRPMVLNCLHALPAATSPPRVVLDTNVSLALFAWADLSCAALATALLEQRLRAVVNAATRAEWLRILERPELRLDATVLARAAAAFDELVVDVETEHSPAPLALPRWRHRAVLARSRTAEAVAAHATARRVRGAQAGGSSRLSRPRTAASPVGAGAARQLLAGRREGSRAAPAPTGGWRQDHGLPPLPPPLRSTTPVATT